MKKKKEEDRLQNSTSSIPSPESVRLTANGFDLSRQKDAAGEVNFKERERTLIDGVPVFCAFDEVVSINELKPNPKNPNTHPESQLKLLGEIIKKTGWRASITVSKLSGLIVKGHGRLYAARRAGLKNCPVEYQTFDSEEEELSALLADNKLAELAEIDTEKLAELFKEADFSDLSLTGYSEKEFSSLVDALEEQELPDEDELTVPEGEPFTKYGDIWHLGNHKLICGDSTLEETYKSLLESEKVDLLITDPPYNVNYEGGTSDKLKILNDNMNSDEFREFLAKAFKNFDNVMRPGASFYIWHADSERYNFQGACQDVEWSVKQCLIWVKNNIVMGRQDYQWKHEPCLYGWKNGAGHYFIDDRTLTTCFEFNKPLRNDIHPTMKPVEMFRFQIGNSSLRGNIVLDGFAGSGTTLIACESIGRIARLIELDPKYCDCIVKRFSLLYPYLPIKCIRNGEDVSREFE